MRSLPRRTVRTERAGLVALAEAFDRASPRPSPNVRSSIGDRPRSSSAGVARAVTSAKSPRPSLDGTPAFFRPSPEASHGDLGKSCADERHLALSWSGEAELKSMVELPGRFDIPAIWLRRPLESSLARQSDIVLPIRGADRSLPHGLPRHSTLLQLALGDALAVASSKPAASLREFHVFHPAVALRRRLNFVRDIMHADDAMPAPNAQHDERSDCAHDRKGPRLPRRRRRAGPSSAHTTATSAAPRARPLSPRVGSDDAAPKTIPPTCWSARRSILNQARSAACSLSMPTSRSASSTFTPAAESRRLANSNQAADGPRQDRAVVIRRRSPHA